MSISDRLLAWLLTYAIHGTALLVLAGIATRWITSPATREIVWKIGLVGPLLTSLIQTLGVEPITARYQIPQVLGIDPSAIRTDVFLDLAGEQRAAEPNGGKERSETDQVPSIAAPLTRTNGTPGPTRFQLPKAGSVILGFWLLGATWFVLGFARRRWELARRLGPRRRLVGDPLVEELDALRARHGVRRRIILTVSDRLASPIAVGLSEICVPTVALAELDDRERVGMLAHELAHLIRLDTVWLSVAALLERVFFFQPLNRVARRRIQADAELLCDEWAAGVMGSGLTVAKCLVKVAEWIDAAPRPIPVAGMAEERSELVDRVQRLVEEGPMSVKPRWRTVVVGVVGLVAGTALIAPNVSLVGQASGKTGLDPVMTAAGESIDGSEAPAAVEIDDAPDGGTSVRIPAAAGPRPEVYQDTSGAVVAALASALKDPTIGVRRAAARSLGNLGDRRAVPALISVIDDDDAEVRAAATDALGQFEDPRAVDALLSRLKDSSAEVRRSALQGLGQFDREIARPEWFRPWLTDGDADTRASAARSLGELKDRASVASLVAMLDDQNADVREAVIGALGDIRDPSAIGPIGGAVKDPNSSIRERALNALGEFELTSTPAGVIQALSDSDPDVRQAAAHLVGHLGDRTAVSALRALLADADKHVREAAVEALSEIRDQAAIDALVGALKSTDPVVRKAAAEALGQRQE